MVELFVLGLFAALFVLAFITKRRFGVLGLGLAAGVVLGAQFRGTVASWLAPSADMLQPFSADTVAISLIVLAPALLLLLGGPKYGSALTAGLGAFGFMVMALALLIEPLSSDSYWLEENLGPIVEVVSQWQSLIVAIGILLAVIDMFLAHNHHLVPKKRKH